MCISGGKCTRTKMLFFYNICKEYREYCIDDNTPPPDYQGVRYEAFMRANELNSSTLSLLRVPLNEILQCKITSGDGNTERNCELDNIALASYYSDTQTPNFCFSFNTRWGNPTAKIQKIKKSEKIQLHFYIDVSHRNKSAPDDLVQHPKYGPLSTSSVQIAIHSQYLTLSPYVFGKGFQGGRNYKIKLKKEEKHLLPPPYQTNCTDYVKTWIKRGGVAPLNQVMAIQECRKNSAVKDIGCVPYSVDYPHNDTICRYCPECKNMTQSGGNCTNVLHFYNQPCNSADFVMNIEEKWVNIVRSANSFFLNTNEAVTFRQKGHNCTFEKMFTKQCQIVNIELDFDEYEVTNMTYNPKFESMELFSVIGGYTGMYLGISLVSIYDFVDMALTTVYRFLKRRYKSNKVMRMKQQIKKAAKEARTNRHSTDFRRRNAAFPYSRRDIY